MENEKIPAESMANLFEQAQMEDAMGGVVSKTMKLIKHNFKEMKNTLIQMIVHFHKSRSTFNDCRPVIAFLSALYESIAKLATHPSKNKAIEVPEVANLLEEILTIHIRAFLIKSNMTVSITLIKSLFHCYPEAILTPEIIKMVSNVAVKGLKTTSVGIKVNSLLIAKVVFDIKEYDHEKLMKRVMKCIINDNETIRKTALNTIPIKSNTFPNLISLVHDTSINIRTEVFQVFTEKGCFLKLPVSSRIVLVYSGLSDINEKVRKSCYNYLSKVCIKSRINSSIATPVSCQESILRLTSPIKEKEVLENCTPAQLLSYFEPRRVLGDHLYGNLIKLLVEYLLDIYDEVQLFAYLRDQIIGGLSELVGEKRKISNIEVKCTPQDISKVVKYEDEELSFLYFAIEVWKSKKDARHLSNLEDIMFEHAVYTKLYKRYEEKGDYFLLYLLVPLIQMIKVNDTLVTNELLKLFEDTITKPDVISVCKTIDFSNDSAKETVDIQYVIHSFTGKPVIHSINDAIREITNQMIFLMRVDKDELLNEFIEKISDIIEPLETLSDISSEKGTKMEQVQANNMIAKQVKDEITQLQASLGKENINNDEISIKIKEKEKIYDGCIGAIVTLKKEIAAITIKSLKFASDLFYWMRAYHIKANTEKLNHCKERLLLISNAASEFINEAEITQVKVLEMIMLAQVLGFDPELFSIHSEVLLEGVTNCTCEPTPCSIASAMCVLDNIIVHSSYVFNADTQKRITMMRIELISMIYSESPEIKLLGISNCIKLITNNKRENPLDILTRIFEQICNMDWYKNNRGFNMIECFIKDYSNESIEQYDLVIESLMIFILLCFGTARIVNIPEGSVINKFAARKIGPTISFVLSKLSISRSALSKKENKDIAAPFYKLCYLIALANSKFDKNGDLTHLLLHLIDNKSLQIESTPRSMERLHMLLKHLAIYKDNKKISNFINKLNKSTSKSSLNKDQLKSYLNKKEALIENLLRTVSTLGNQYANEDITHVNMTYSDAIRYRTKPDFHPMEAITFDKLLMSQIPTSSQKKPMSLLKEPNSNLKHKKI